MAWIYGDNTDGVGLVRDIVENLDMLIAGKRVLLLGAGGWCAAYAAAAGRKTGQLDRS